MNKILFYIALTGWTLGLFVHLLSIENIDVADKLPFVWALHVGIFVVWIPAVLESIKSKELHKQEGWVIQGKLNLNSMYSYFSLFKETPMWITVIAHLGFIYAGFNFWILMDSTGTPEIKDGHFILQNRGEPIKIITELEYHHRMAKIVRGFSGHWILFYGMATAILYKFSGLRKP